MLKAISSCGRSRESVSPPHLMPRLVISSAIRCVETGKFRIILIVRLWFK